MNFKLGFTLVELIIVVAISAILITVAVPGFNSMVLDNRMTTYANEFVTSLNLTRSEAIKRGLSVTMCKSDTPNTCGPNDDTWGWNQGWIIFSDSNENRVLDAGDELIRVREGLNKNYTIFANSANTATIGYSSTGYLNSTARSFVLCDKRGFGKDAKIIVVNQSGRPNVINASDPIANVTDCDAS